VIKGSSDVRIEEKEWIRDVVGVCFRSGQIWMKAGADPKVRARSLQLS
jgi:hypothetical protein